MFCCFFLQLDPDTVWLREEHGSHVFIPDSANTFILPENVSSLEVMGSPIEQLQRPTIPHMTAEGSSGTSRPHAHKPQSCTKKRIIARKITGSTKKKGLCVYRCPICKYKPALCNTVVLQRLDELLEAITHLLDSQVESEESEFLDE